MGNPDPSASHRSVFPSHPTARSRKRICASQGTLDFPTKMPYADIWTNNWRHRLLEEASTPAKPENKLVIPAPPRWVTVHGEMRENKSRLNGWIPTNITHLDISKIRFDERYDVQIPAGVKWLNLSDTNYQSWFMSIPDTVETIVYRTSHCGNPWGYPKPKPGVKVLDLTGHPNLHGFAELPDSLEVLILKDCRMFQVLPDRLPKNLRVLDVSGCRLLTKLPTDVPEGLKEIWADGCDLVDEWLWRNGYKWGVGSYWATPKFLRQMHEGREEFAQERVQKRTRALRQEIVAAAYHPRRVERWLEARGWDILEEMLG